MRSITARLADVNQADSVSARARARRWSKFLETFPDLVELDVLDLGGTPHFWRETRPHPRSVTVLNLESYDSSVPWIETAVGDACQPPDHISGRTFDLVFSNSVVEHIVGMPRRREFAAAVRELGRAYWVQTPYRYFPLEPHWLFPGIQWMPLPARAWLTRHYRWGHMYSPSRRDSIERASEIELLTITELSYLFPNSEVWIERFLGAPKSLVCWNQPVDRC